MYSLKYFLVTEQPLEQTALRAITGILPSELESPYI